MTNTFTAIYEKRGDVYIGYVEELPGANTQGDTLEEVKANLKEAVELILLSNRQFADH
jgi:predicted RNase H-like HicB family nuclease